MNDFRNEKYIAGLTECGVSIKERYKEIASKATEKKTDEYSDEEVKALIYLSAWDSFENLYRNYPVDLYNKTEFNRHDFHDKYIIEAVSFERNEKYFLFALLRFLFEYHSWVEDYGHDVISDSWDYKNYKSICKLDEIEHWNSKPIFQNTNVKFIWVKVQMPYLIVRHFLKSEKINKVSILFHDIDNAKEDIEEFVSDAKNEATSSIKYVDSLKSEVLRLEERFFGVKSEGNFKLLSKGFSTIRKAKRHELVFSHLRTWLFLLLLIAVPIWMILYHPIGVGVQWFIDLPSLKPNEGSVKVFDWGEILFYIPFVTLELLFFYFMRVFYGELKSIRAQLLQIDLRLNLCEFMHDYAETRSKSTSDKNSDSWKSFENLIFSPLQVNDDKIPAVLDGADAIAELAGKIMARKPS
ncbi:hypothetical protein ABRP77_17790 [Pectobacterium odoriferum]|uniref:hypothetical protein n=1 Tax=Pectobacterium odoriferum TaxID=78398 RepID=UPI0032EDB391